MFKKLIEIIKELDVEVTKPNIFQAIVAKQYDMNTRFLKVTLKDGGNRIDVPLIDTAKVVINAERKDGQSKGFDGVINEDGTVTVPLHSWMLELDGTVICDISVMDIAEDDNKKLTTTSFTLLVEKAAYGGNDITSDPQYDVLVQLLETCSEATTAAEEALQKSNEANAKYEACVEATENANAATEELGTIKEELAEGGYITGIKESNHGNILGFWVGTQAEYDALETPPQNSYVVISDDKTLENIIKSITELQAKADVVEPVYGTYDPTFIDAEGQRVVADYEFQIGRFCKIDKLIHFWVDMKGKVNSVLNTNHAQISLPTEFTGKTANFTSSVVVGECYNITEWEVHHATLALLNNGQPVVGLKGGTGDHAVPWKLNSVGWVRVSGSFMII